MTREDNEIDKLTEDEERIIEETIEILRFIVETTEKNPNKLIGGCYGR